MGDRFELPPPWREILDELRRIADALEARAPKRRAKKPPARKPTAAELAHVHRTIDAKLRRRGAIKR